MDDWDSVSDTTSPNSTTDPSDTVSTPQPPTRRRRVIPDNLMLDDLTASQQEAPVTPPDAQQHPFFLPHASMTAQQDATVMVAASASAGTFALPRIFTLSRYRQIIRNILALLSAALFFELELVLCGYFAFASWLLSRSFLILLIILWPYVAGIFTAAISGNRGFDALIPVFIGCVVGFAGFALFLYSGPGAWLILSFMFLLLSLLGATTYIVIQKLRSRSTRRRVNK